MARVLPVIITMAVANVLTMLASYTVLDNLDVMLEMPSVSVWISGFIATLTLLALWRKLASPIHERVVRALLEGKSLLYRYCPEIDNKLPLVACTTYVDLLGLYMHWIYNMLAIANVTAHAAAAVTAPLKAVDESNAAAADADTFLLKVVVNSSASAAYAVNCVYYCKGLKRVWATCGDNLWAILSASERMPLD